MLTLPNKIYENFSRFYSAESYSLFSTLWKRSRPHFRGRRHGTRRGQAIQSIPGHLARVAMDGRRKDVGSVCKAPRGLVRCKGWRGGREPYVLGRRELPIERW